MANFLKKTARSLTLQLPRHQHFADVVAAQEELDGRIIAEQVLDVAIVEDALQPDAADAMQLQRVLGRNVVAVERRFRTGVLGVKERQQQSSRTHSAMDTLNQRLYQRLRKEIRKVPEQHRIELFAPEAEVLAQVAFDVERCAAVAVRYQQHLVVGVAQHVFLLEAVSQAGHEGDIGGRGGSEIEYRETLFPRNGANKLVEAGGSPAELIGGLDAVVAPPGATKQLAEDTGCHGETL